MLTVIFVEFFDLFVSVFNILIIIRIVMSWVAPQSAGHGFGKIIHDLTEPVLASLRKVIPGGGMIDWAPLVSILGLQLLQMLIHRLLLG